MADLQGKPKIIIFDIETLPIADEVLKHYAGLSNRYGLTFKAQITSIACFGWKELGSKETHIISAWDSGKNVNDDKKVCKEIAAVLNDCDAVVTHNGTKFDWKHIQTRMIANDLDPLPKILHMDTCNVARKNLLALNNKLGNLGEWLLNEKKIDNGGWDLWIRVLKGEKKAFKEMEDYCKQDVKLTEKVFLKLRPLVENYPNFGMFTRAEFKCCPKCGSFKVHRSGTRTTKTGIYYRYKCEACASWMQGKERIDARTYVK